MKESPHTGHKEITIKGLASCPGIAIGKAHIYNKGNYSVRMQSIEETEVPRHLERFLNAQTTLERELTEAGDGNVTKDVRDILAAQIEIVNDPEVCKHIKHLIEEEHYAADRAIYRAFERYIDLLNNASNSEAKERAVDISDIRDRLIELARQKQAIPQLHEGHILVATELSPREVIELSGKNIQGIIMERSGPTAHAAIIARSMRVPTVVGAHKATKLIAAGDTVVFDGDTGTIIVGPDQKTLKEFESLKKNYENFLRRAGEICKRESVTVDGQSFNLRANIEFVEELNQVKEVRAEGIGLVRTESMYLERNHFGDIEKQEAFYRSILEATGDDPVTIRLFDAGGDKIVRRGRNEQNPFLGWRGVRMLLDERELLQNQLRAILKTAGRYPGRLRLLIPMLTVLEEVLEVKKEIQKIQQQLKEEGQAVDADLKIGIMVEVPSVAVQAELFAGHIDFFSIGTNDLTQYMLAVDRGNELVSGLYDQRDPAVLKVISRVADAAHAANIEIAVCGELASKPASAACLLGMGINELSMVPISIPAVKKMLTEKSFKDMQALATQALYCATVQEVLELFNQWSNT